MVTRAMQLSSLALLVGCAHHSDDMERLERVLAENCDRVEVIYETANRRITTEPDRRVLKGIKSNN